MLRTVFSSSHGVCAANRQNHPWGNAECFLLGMFFLHVSQWSNTCRIMSILHWILFSNSFMCKSSICKASWCNTTKNRQSCLCFFKAGSPVYFPAALSGVYKSVLTPQTPSVASHEAPVNLHRLCVLESLLIGVACDSNPTSVSFSLRSKKALKGS